jgi:hypothetical protein
VPFSAAAAAAAVTLRLAVIACGEARRERSPRASRRRPRKRSPAGRIASGLEEETAAAVEYMATASAGGELGRSAEVAEVVYEASRVADAARLGGACGFWRRAEDSKKGRDDAHARSEMGNINILLLQYPLHLITFFLKTIFFLIWKQRNNYIFSLSNSFQGWKDGFLKEAWLQAHRIKLDK